MDGLDHPLQHGIEDLARLFRIAMREQLHRALNVGEEDRGLLALALDAGARGADASREMAGRVGGGCREAPGSARERRAAIVAEATPRGVREAAGRAKRVKTFTTCVAEARAGRI